jgi:hypothetical protein
MIVVVTPATSNTTEVLDTSGLTKMGIATGAIHIFKPPSCHEARGSSWTLSVSVRPQVSTPWPEFSAA